MVVHNGVITCGSVLPTRKTMFMVNEKNLSWVFLSQRRRVCVVQSLVDNVAKCEGYGVMC